MKSKENCCLCNIVSGVYKHKSVDAPFMESENYIAVASIGAFIEGWTLIVPKNHQLSLAQNYLDPEFINFANLVNRHVIATYDETVMFEHGANNEGSITGCGVDHAHFHIVPSKQSLSPAMLKTGLEWTRVDSESTNLIPELEDYLLYVTRLDDQGIEGLLSTPSNPESQFFRRLLAHQYGLADVFDYKKHSHLEKSVKTRATLAI